jgi:hypothetical protein
MRAHLNKSRKATLAEFQLHGICLSEKRHFWHSTSSSENGVYKGGFEVRSNN